MTWNREIWGWITGAEVFTGVYWQEEVVVMMGDAHRRALDGIL